MSRLQSFAYALRGLRILFQSQVNARIHLVAAALVLGLGAGLALSAGEWIGLVVAITLVMVAEALNTALELVVDLASLQWRPLARDAKDVAAASVLLASIGALAIGAFIVLPKLWRLLAQA